MDFGLLGRGFGGLGVIRGKGKLVPAGLDLDFANGVYTGALLSDVACARNSAGTDLIWTSASGASYSTFTANNPRITSGLGLLVENQRSNFLINSAAPVTQTRTLGAATYTLWVNGTGSCAVTTGTATITGAGTASQGSPLVFVVTVTGTVVFTITGSLNAFQCENGAFPTSLIVTAAAAGTRIADVVSLTNPPTLGSAYTLFVQATPLAPTSFASTQMMLMASSGAITNGITLYSNSSAVAEVDGATSGAGIFTVAFTTWAQNVAGKLATAIADGAQQAAFNGALGAAGNGSPLPSGVNSLTFGSRPGGATPFYGYIARVREWPNTALSSATLQSLTV